RMHRTLTRPIGGAAPSGTQPGDMQVSVIVFAVPALAGSNAPSSRGRHLVKGAVVHWLSAVQATAGGPWKVGANCWAQKPQNTKLPPDPPPRRAEVFDDVPVESANGIGRAPMLAAAVGGQSWLVGLAAGDCPGMTSLSGVQGWPAFGPAEQVPPVQSGHGTSPSVGPAR